MASATWAFILMITAGSPAVSTKGETAQDGSTPRRPSH